MRLSQFITALSVFLASFAAADGPQARLVPDRPSEGRFVRTPLGFMVPYEQRIPGSNAVIKMVPVPGGTITLGALPPPRYRDASGNEIDAPSPAQPEQSKTKTVSFGPFWIGKYEITMQQYMPYRQLYYQQKEDQAKGRDTSKVKLDDLDAVSGPTDVYDTRYNFEYAAAPDSPVPTVSQFATRQYTKWLSLVTGTTYRLPLRSEWQHACLAGSKSNYCFGDDDQRLNEYAVFADNAPDERVIRIGSKKTNAWGLHDVHGNMSEFVVEDTAMTGMKEGHVACGGNFNTAAADCAFDSVIRTTEDWWDHDPDLPRSSWWMTSEESRATSFRIISPLESMSAKQKRVFWDADSEELAQDVRSRIDEGRGSLGRVSKPTATTRRID